MRYDRKTARAALRAELEAHDNDPGDECPCWLPCVVCDPPCPVCAPFPCDGLGAFTAEEGKAA